MTPEAKAAHTIRRAVTRETLGRFVFRSERIFDPDSRGYSDFENRVAEGYGGIIVLKHFSLKDPPHAITDIVMPSPVLRTKEVVVPNAKHQIYPGVPQFAGLHGIKIDPIVTERTVEKAREKGKPEPKLNEGSDEFVKDALDYLKRGQLVAIAPEGTRRPNLEPYGKNSIGALLGAVRLARTKVAALFVDFRVHGHEGWDRSGFNMLSRYETRIGRCLTSEEILAAAGGKFREVDDKVILPEMRRTAAIKRPNQGRGPLRISETPR